MLLIISEETDQTTDEVIFWLLCNGLE